ncbi:DUF6340 family protein [Bacteroidota bacterium]
MKRTFTIIFISICLFMISGAPTITFRVLFSAPVDITHDIQSLAIIDRSVPSDDLRSILEGVLTGELPGQDKLATQYAIDGVSDIMLNSSRFKVIRTTEMLEGSKSGSTFPDPLEWGLINGLCRKYDVDAILSLETFDSDYIVTNASKQVEEKDKDGKIVKRTVFTAEGVATVSIGFRIYEPGNRNIEDQFHVSHNMRWDASGNSITNAVELLINKDGALKEVSYNAGNRYARRLTPMWYSVSRKYYRKSKKDMDLAEGARMMEVNDWDNAIIALERAVENGHRKTRGKAAHNLAVVYEILGDLDQAKSWASNAWGKYNNKGSRDYGYDLTRRMNDQRRLDNQLDRE